ncbi:MAG: hypothetical protein PHD03_04145 [Bacilli bacterium]|nr:hypothetical protein [Bacilli bacterium]MDD4407071.1 hypothetical protein [Bacilli bacterium]
MKKVFPYLLSLFLGGIFGFMLFKDNYFNIKEVFANTLEATAFQLGVFNNEESALLMKNNYKDSIIIKDDDVYRVYFSILSNNIVIAKMEKYLINQKINYYLKNITITDKNLITALNEYEKVMIEGTNDILVSINGLIMSSYKGDTI